MFFFIVSFFLLLSFWIWIIRKYDKFEREPLKTIVYVLVVGGLISVIPAGLFNVLFSQMIDYPFGEASYDNVSAAKAIVFYGFVGLNEEFFKAFAAVILLRRLKDFNEPADALVYSMTVALGFAMLENIEYVLRYGFFSLYVRQFNAVPLHLGLAAIWGMGIAKAKFLNRGKYTRTLVPYVALAGFLHFVYNIVIVLPVNPLLKLLIPTLLAIYLIRHAIKRIRHYSEDGPFSTILICRNCNTPNQPHARICKNCSQSLELKFYDLCETCNHRISKDAEGCVKCEDANRISQIE
jgi:protease PrsW